MVTTAEQRALGAGLGDCWRAFYPEERLMKSDQKEVAAARAVIEAALDAMGPGPDEHRGR